ncbi:LacI family DNA-binding transcriptional regulator [Streptosporangium longisporum]|uniref:LacI family DNA-binding transcriptional regulator n=1 Tax=Streptosporangium longisporum TaxID=46187 RepID=A0ABP6KED2_9ACTN
MPRPRIKDVAALAGVGTTTVSVVLNNVDGVRVTAETRQRILDAAQELGYSSDPIARSLRTRRTRTIGFVSDVIATTPFAGRMIQGAQEVAWRAGYLLVLVNTGGDREVQEKTVRELLKRQVDGVLFAVMYHQEIEVPSALATVKTVLLDARPTDGALPHVVPDEHEGALTAVGELIGAGHRRIGFATESLPVPAASGRLGGYTRALEAAGIPFEPGLVAAEHGDTPGGYRAARRLLELPEPPTAIFCYNDRMAMGCYRAAAELGFAIPADLSVVGYDDQDLIAPALFPALTTVALPHYEMGAWAARRLLDLIEDEPREEAPGHLMPCPLIRRDSVGPPPR